MLHGNVHPDFADVARMLRRGLMLHVGRRAFLRGMGLGALQLALSPRARAQPRRAGRTNILFILADDHAASAIASYAGPLATYAPTAAIDRIAREGVRLDRCLVTNSLCGPSRAAILTGQYSHRNGVYTQVDSLDPAREHVAKLLQRAGYQTAIVGKWHLHTEPSGFDYYNVLPSQGRYHDPRLKEKGQPWQDRHRGGEPHPGYVTDVITDVSLAWLRRRDPARPFFLMCHHKAPHGLWEYAERHRSLFAGVTLPEPPDLVEGAGQPHPVFGKGLLELAERMGRGVGGRRREYPTGRLDTSGMSSQQKVRAAYQKFIKDYLRCVAAIDESVSRLLDYLDREGLGDDTLVIYTSDQGLFLGEHHLLDKKLMYEESLRMPFLARLPGAIHAGTASDALALNVDFAPTFLDYAGLPASPAMQGRSLRRVLEGETPPDWRRSIYYHFWQHGRFPAHYGVRTDRHKLIFFYGLDLRSGRVPPTPPRWELFDLAVDPNETTDLYADPAHAGVVEHLKSELGRLKRELGDTQGPMPN